MYISARERQILEILLTESNELTVKDLADQIGVSGRTIHRDLKNVEDILEEYQLTLEKKSGVGIQVYGDKSKIHELELFLYNLFQTEYTPDERQTFILCELLESNGPVKLLGLANDLNVTIATVSNDLTKLEERLHTFGLSLVRRRGYGVEIEGPERAKRRAMRNMISEYLDESEILSFARESIQRRSTQAINTISERLLGLVEKKKLLIVEKVIESISQDLPYSMADSAYIGLVVHLALAVERIQKGEGIKIDPSYLENQQATKEYKFAKKIVDQLEQVFQIQIPEAEIGYITMHLKGAKVRHDNEYLIEASSSLVAVKARGLIESVGKQIGKDLSNNRSLYEGLILHLKPALYRLKQKMGISNPLMEKVKKDYGELFSIVKQACDQVFHEFHVPDEEIGYLVMHFGAAVLGNKEMGNIKTLVICSSGIGTSKILAMRLEKEFPEMKQVQNVSVMEFKKMDIHDYQLIISTIPIPDFRKDYIIVSPMLTKAEIEKIHAFIHEHFRVNGQKRSVDLSSENKGTMKNSFQFVQELGLVKEYAQTIMTILEGFSLKEVNGQASKEEILQQSCEELYQKRRINNVEEVVHSLLEREKLGGIGIPNTSMALFHARSNNVIEPCFVISVIQKPLQVSGMDQSSIEVKHLVLLLSPIETSKSVLEVLSYISTLLIESEESISIFQSNDCERILSFITAKLDQLFQEKLHDLRRI